MGVQVAWGWEVWCGVIVQQRVSCWCGEGHVCVDGGVEVEGGVVASQKGVRGS